jgi:hypothetical protein
VPLKYKHSAKENTRRDHAHKAERNLDAGSSTSVAALAGSCRRLAVGSPGRGTRASSGSRLAGLTCKVGARALETQTGTSAVLHEVRRLLGDRGKRGSLNIPLIRSSGALGSRAVLLEATGAGGVVGLLVCGLEALEVVVGGDLAVAANLDNSIAVRLNGVLVCETSRVDAGHVGVVQRSNLTPLASVGDAAKLGQEDRLAVALVGLDLLVPTGDCERGGVAPGVIVEGEEVGALVVGAAVEVQGLGLDVLSDISSRVSDRNLASLAVRDVLLHVTGNGLDVGGRVGVGLVVDDLVTGEEEEQVAVVGESVDGSKDVLEVDVVVRAVEGLSILTVERVLWCVGIESKVDTCIIKQLHALIVVLRVVDCVDTDGVDTEVLEVDDITLQVLDIKDGILCVGSTTLKLLVY